MILENPELALEVVCSWMFQDVFSSDNTWYNIITVVSAKIDFAAVLKRFVGINGSQT